MNDESKARDEWERNRKSSQQEPIQQPPQGPDTMVVGISREEFYEWIRSKVAVDLSQLGLSITDVGVHFKCILFVEGQNWPGPNDPTGNPDREGRDP